MKITRKIEESNYSGLCKTFSVSVGSSFEQETMSAVLAQVGRVFI